MLSLILGIVFTALGVLGLIHWFEAFKLVVKGGVPICLVFAGVLAIIIGISTLKESAQEQQAKKEEPAAKPEEKK